MISKGFIRKELQDRDLVFLLKTSAPGVSNRQRFMVSSFQIYSGVQTFDFYSWSLSVAQNGCNRSQGCVSQS